MKKQWLLKPQNKDVSKLSKQLNISPITAQIITDRGFTSKEAALQFLQPDLAGLHSPYLMPDMEKAVNRIVQALSKKESIIIYGDYDVDGQTSIVLLVEVLRSLTDDPDLINYYIPHRMEDGYGLHQEALEELSHTCSLVITVDCGISAISEAQYAKNIGLDLIITDHHQPHPELPDAVAVVNPKRTDSQYPFPELAGVGVAYKLVQALGEYYQRDFSQWLDIVALGTVADLVPLIAENRILVKHGLLQMEKTDILGLKSLIQVCGLKPPYKASDLGFKLGPRLNAVGRMGESARGVELLLSRNRNQALRLAEILDNENRIRQETEQEIFDDVVAVIEKEGWTSDPGIIVAGHWHPGVIGIVASRIVEKYYRPTIIISVAEGIGKGSGRSISGFNIYEGLEQVSDLLLQFGGHEMAAGLTIAEEQIDNLRHAFGKIIEQTLHPDDFLPKVRVDYKLGINQITPQLLQEFKLLEPFGMGNPTPVLQISGAVLNTRSMGAAGDHLRCTIQDQQGYVMEAVGFGMYNAMEKADPYREQVNFAVFPQPGFRDPAKIELIVRDFQAKQEPTDFIADWMLARYPWELGADYEAVSHLDWDFNSQELHQVATNLVDNRGVWNQNQVLRELLDPNEKVLIYVATPRRSLEVCRELRIAIPNGSNFIGFEHELLASDQRSELEELIRQDRINWVVTTGIWQSERQWEKIVLYDAFSDQNLWLNLNAQLDAKGSMIFAYGREQCTWLQGRIISHYPDRNLFARFYLAMTRHGKGKHSVTELENIAQGLHLTNGLNYIIDVFDQLELVRKEGQEVKIMPKPAQKLDLTNSVLYNRGKIKRKQYLSYLQHCLERGFLNELKRKNSYN